MSSANGALHGTRTTVPFAMPNRTISSERTSRHSNQTLSPATRRQATVRSAFVKTARVIGSPTPLSNGGRGTVALRATPACAPGLAAAATGRWPRTPQPTAPERPTDDSPAAGTSCPYLFRMVKWRVTRALTDPW